MPHSKGLTPPPVRSELAGRVIARLYRMGLKRFHFKTGALNKVLGEMDLNELGLWAMIATTGPDEQMIYHLRKAGLYEDSVSG